MSSLPVLEKRQDKLSLLAKIATARLMRQTLHFLEEIHQASDVNIYLNVLKTKPRKVLMTP